MLERPLSPANRFDPLLWRRSQRLSFEAQKRKMLEAKRPHRPRLTKLQKIELALRQPSGASLAELRQLTGWQAHSVRGAISGWLKKKKGLAIVSECVSDGRRYLISDRAPASESIAHGEWLNDLPLLVPRSTREAASTRGRNTRSE